MTELADVGGRRRARVLGVTLVLAGVFEVLANLLEHFSLDSKGLASAFAIAPGWWRFELIGVTVIGVGAIAVGAGVLRVHRLIAPVFCVLPLLLLTIGGWEMPASLKPDSDFGLGAGTFATLLQVVMSLVALWCAIELMRRSDRSGWGFNGVQAVMGLAASVCVVSFLFINGWYRFDTHVIPEAQRAELFGARVSFEFPVGVIGGVFVLVLTLLFLALMTFARDQRISAWTALGVLGVQVLAYADELRTLWWGDAPPGWGNDVHANATLMVLVGGVALLAVLSVLQFRAAKPAA